MLSDASKSLLRTSSGAHLLRVPGFSDMDLIGEPCGAVKHALWWVFARIPSTVRCRKDR